MPKIEIRSLRTMRGEETPAFTGTLYVDDVKCADLHSEGTGGSIRITWFTGLPWPTPTGAALERAKQEAEVVKAKRLAFTEAALAAYAKGDPEVRSDLEAFHAIVDPTVTDSSTVRWHTESATEVFLFTLVDNMALIAKLKRTCRSATIYRKPGDKRGTYWRVPRKYDPVICANIAAKHPGAVFLNEVIADGREIPPEFFPQ